MRENHGAPGLTRKPNSVSSASCSDDLRDVAKPAATLAKLARGRAASAAQSCAASGGAGRRTWPLRPRARVSSPAARRNCAAASTRKLSRTCALIAELGNLAERLVFAASATACSRGQAARRESIRLRVSASTTTDRPAGCRNRRATWRRRLQTRRMRCGARRSSRRW